MFSLNSVVRRNKIKSQTVYDGEVVDIAAGYRHTIFAKADGSVWGCGSTLNNSFGVFIGSSYGAADSCEYPASGGQTQRKLQGENSFFKNYSVNSSCLSRCGQDLDYYQVPINNLRIDTTKLNQIVAGYDNTFIINGSDKRVWGCGLNSIGSVTIHTNYESINLPNITSFIPLCASSTTPLTAVAVDSNLHSLFLQDDGTVLAYGASSKGEYGAQHATTTSHIRSLTRVGEFNENYMFFGSEGAVYDSLNNLYIADTNNHTIRKITPSGIITTFAGWPGRRGSQNGRGTKSRFNLPRGIAKDSFDNLYVADSNNQTIRKITPSGLVTTLAGTVGRAGRDDGIGTSAQFYFPWGIAIDPSNNIYVSDRQNHTIRQITPLGVVTTVCGGEASVAGTTNGLTFDAQYDLTDCVFDTAGNCYATATNEHVIVKILPTGELSIFAGIKGKPGGVNGPTALTSSFTSPAGIAIDSAGSLYISEDSHIIRKITTSGTVSTFAGTAFNNGKENGTGAAARFKYPRGIKIDSSDNLYVCDTTNHTIRKITSAGVVSTFAGVAETIGHKNGSRSAAEFNHPYDIEIDSSGNLYVADRNNHVIRKITTGGIVSDFVGFAKSPADADGTTTAARLSYPQWLTIDSSNNLYLTQWESQAAGHLLKKITSAGVMSTFAGNTTMGFANGTGTAARFRQLRGITKDSSGNLYVVDGFYANIRKVTISGAVVTTGFGPFVDPNRNVLFNGPQGLALDSSNALYVADSENHVIRKIVFYGEVTTFAGTMSQAGKINTDDYNTAKAAKFNLPNGITIVSGNLFVTEQNNFAIRKIYNNGVVATFAGKLDYDTVSKTGVGTAASFNTPRAITNDSSGNLYVVENISHTIKKVTPGAIVSDLEIKTEPKLLNEVTTFAGLARTEGPNDGIGSAARFYRPSGIIKDSSGNFFITDQTGQNVRKMTPEGVVSTFAGSVGSYGISDGLGTDARFRDPGPIAIDSFDNLYVNDATNFTIRKITPAGQVTTFAGLAQNSGTTDGTGSAARFSRPTALSIDSLNNIYVCEYLAHTIRKITPGGDVSTFAGRLGIEGSQNGAKETATFKNPSGITIDSFDNIYVSEYNHTIRKITPDGIVSTFAGSVGNSGSADGIGTAARFNSPNGLTVDSSNNIYVTTSEHTIRKITPTGTVTTIAGRPGIQGNADGLGTAATFRLPYEMVVDSSNNLYITDLLNSTIRKLTLGDSNTLTDVVAVAAGSGHSVFLKKDGTVWACGDNTYGQLGAPAETRTGRLVQVQRRRVAIPLPRGVVYDSMENMFVLSPNNITKISITGVATTFATVVAVAMCIDEDDNIYVTCWEEIKIINSKGIVVKTIATPGIVDRGIVADSKGNLYTASEVNHVIRKIVIDTGIITIVAGINNSAGDVNGDGSISKFNKPKGIAIDSQGNLYVADSSNGDIRRIKTTGQVDTFITGINSPQDVAIEGDTMIVATAKMKYSHTWGAEVSDGLVMYSYSLKTQSLLRTLYTANMFELVPRGVAIKNGVSTICCTEMSHVITPEVLSRNILNPNGETAGQPSYTTVGQVTVQPSYTTSSPLTGIVQIAAGSGHSLFLGNDGVVWTAGTHTYNTGTGSVAVRQPALSGVIAMSSSKTTSYFLGSYKVGFDQDRPVTNWQVSTATTSLFLTENGQLKMIGSDMQLSNNYVRSQMIGTIYTVPQYIYMGAHMIPANVPKLVTPPFKRITKMSVGGGHYGVLGDFQTAVNSTLNYKRGFSMKGLAGSYSRANRYYGEFYISPTTYGYYNLIVGEDHRYGHTTCTSVLSSEFTYIG